MTSGMSADEYMAQFEILAARMSFNDPAFEDAYSHGLTAMILDKIDAQPLLPKDLKAWKEAACKIHRNHCHLLEVKRGQVPLATTCFTAAWTNTISVPTNPVVTNPPDTFMSMDIDPVLKTGHATIVTSKGTSHLTVQNLASNESTPISQKKTSQG